MQSSKTGVITALLVGLVSLTGSALAQTSPAQTTPLPSWAYPWVPDFKLPPDDGVPRRVPDSTETHTVTQERDLFFAPVWHQADHPPLSLIHISEPTRPY